MAYGIKVTDLSETVDSLKIPINHISNRNILDMLGIYIRLCKIERLSNFFFWNYIHVKSKLITIITLNSSKLFSKFELSPYDHS